MEFEGVQRRVLDGVCAYFKDNLIDSFVPILRMAFCDGALFVVYEKESEWLANDVVLRLKSGGYRVFSICANDDENRRDTCDIPDYARYILCVGECDAIAFSKALAQRFDIGWSLFCVAPTSDDVMQGKRPKQVFIDKNVLIKCRNEQIACGYGLLLSSKLVAFERLFSNKVLAIGKREFAPFDCKQTDVAEMVWELLNLSLYNTKDCASALLASAMRSLAIKKGKTPRLEGEYRFFASCVLWNFYCAFLGEMSIDCAPPPCIESDTAQFSHGYALAKDCKCVDFFDINSYFRIGYVLGEYRLDLLEKLKSVDIHSLERFWRRLYKDAGYWLKDEISASEVLGCMRVAGAMSDGLLGYAYASGIMKNFG